MRRRAKKHIAAYVDVDPQEGQQIEDGAQRLYAPGWRDGGVKWRFQAGRGYRCCCIFDRRTSVVPLTREFDSRSACATMALRSCRYSRRGSTSSSISNSSRRWWRSIARQAGFETKAKDFAANHPSRLERAGAPGASVLLRCSRSGQSRLVLALPVLRGRAHGSIMQTPMTLANKRDRGGKAQFHAVRLTICKELPAAFRLPGRPTADRASLLSPVPEFFERADEERGRGMRRWFDPAPGGALGNGRLAKLGLELLSAVDLGQVPSKVPSGR